MLTVQSGLLLCQAAWFSFRKALLGAATLAMGFVLSTTTTHADERVYDQAVRSTVWVVTETGCGTGVVVANPQGRKLVATANHIVEDASQVLCFFAAFDDDGELITDRTHYGDPLEALGVRARVINADPRCDLALLEPEQIPENIPALPLARRVLVGSQIHIVGNSPAAPLFGYISGTVRGVFNSVSRPQGPVFPGGSGHTEDSSPLDAKYFTTDAAVNPGDSGGPVIYRRGNDQLELVGLVSSFTISARMVSNIIHVSELAELLAQPPQARTEGRHGRKPRMRKNEFEFEFQPTSATFDSSISPDVPPAVGDVSRLSLVGSWRTAAPAGGRDLRISFEGDGRCLVLDETGNFMAFGSYSLRGQHLSINAGQFVVLQGQVTQINNTSFELTQSDGSNTQFVRE